MTKTHGRPFGFLFLRFVLIRSKFDTNDETLVPWTGPRASGDLSHGPSRVPFMGRKDPFWNWGGRPLMEFSCLAGSPVGSDVLHSPSPGRFLDDTRHTILFCVLTATEEDLRLSPTRSNGPVPWDYYAPIMMTISRNRLVFAVLRNYSRLSLSVSRFL